MKRGALVGLIVAGVIVIGGGAGVVAALGGAPAGDAAPGAAATIAPTASAAAGSSEATQAPGPSSSESAQPGADATAADAPSTPGAYVDYSESALAAAEGTRVLFFHATWCPKCRELDASIRAEGVPDGVTILKVDYDTGTELRQRYDVRQQTTLVALDENGGATASFVAYDDPSLGAALAGVGLAG